MSLHKIRREYHGEPLEENGVHTDPFIQFDIWFKEASDSGIEDVNAMVLATSKEGGTPSARMVLLKHFDKKGFAFFTDYQSRKGKELNSNPRAALLIYWKELNRQVRIEGDVKKVSEKESDEYFNSRPEQSRMSAIVSPQSSVVESREWLENEFNLVHSKNAPLTRPVRWGGYRLLPLRIEFWQGRPNRLHDRILYQLTDGKWEICRLAP
jgi:pyridoxamine 5'-phosphate oxidase